MNGILLLLHEWRHVHFCSSYDEWKEKGIILLSYATMEAASFLTELIIPLPRQTS